MAVEDKLKSGRFKPMHTGIDLNILSSKKSALRHHSILREKEEAKRELEEARKDGMLQRLFNFGESKQSSSPGAVTLETNSSASSTSFDDPAVGAPSPNLESKVKQPPKTSENRVAKTKLNKRSSYLGPLLGNSTGSSHVGIQPGTISLEMYEKEKKAMIERDEERQREILQ